MYVLHQCLDACSDPLNASYDIGILSISIKGIEQIDSHNIN